MSQLLSSIASNFSSQFSVQKCSFEFRASVSYSTLNFGGNTSLFLECLAFSKHKAASQSDSSSPIFNRTGTCKDTGNLKLYGRCRGFISGSDISTTLGRRRREEFLKRKPIRRLLLICSIAFSAGGGHSEYLQARPLIPVSDGNELTFNSPTKAAFFDVDGTITRTNVVLAYFAVRMSELSFLKKLLWLPWFALTSIFYILVDRMDRATFNRIFYMSYRGRSVECKTRMANLIYEQYYLPRVYTGAKEHIHYLKKNGYKIVFVTGALDFQIAPLAEALGADFLYAAELVEENGKFTGELKGMATSNSEKAERVLDYARRNCVSLGDSLAFGDSIADISMLEMVGRAYAVNPDSRLHAVALKRGWSILNWRVHHQNPAVTVPA